MSPAGITLEAEQYTAQQEMAAGTVEASDWHSWSQFCLFFSKSLLSPIKSETSAVFDAGFWREFHVESANRHIIRSISALTTTASRLASLAPANAIELLGVEYTRLFIGPGRPAAPPWESLYREGNDVLFGQPTLEMRRLLALEGVKVKPSGHQFEDHIGYELVYLGLRFACFAKSSPSVADLAELASFIELHPLSFIGQLHERAVAAASIRFYPALIDLAWGFLLLVKSRMEA
jgi:TorA maturation chaperone TorD